MDLVSVHFFVDDAARSRDWFVKILGMQPLGSSISTNAHTEIVGDGDLLFLLSSPVSEGGAIADYLKQHPPGVVDLAFQVDDLDAVLDRAWAQGCQITQRPQCAGSALCWVQIKGWGTLHHTLIERASSTDDSSPIDKYEVPLWPSQTPSTLKIALNRPCSGLFLSFDHAVFNVAQGELARAVSWYERALGFERQQAFDIETDYSGLLSQVLRHPSGSAQLPINEPTTATSQIQDFLVHNRGSGVQHVALRVRDAVEALGQLRQRGLMFLDVPKQYYDQRSSEIKLDSWDAIAHQQLLVDWRDENPNALLLQAFTQPIFEEPTFFFEIIERRTYRDQSGDRLTEGFGEGNFQALFEAIEREQLNRSPQLQNAKTYSNPR